MILFILVVATISGLIYWYCRYETRKSAQEFAEAEKKNAQFIEFEKSMPNLQLMAIDEKGFAHFSTEITEPIVKYLYYWDGPNYLKRTKRDIAEARLRNVYEQGYFLQSDGVTIPVCNLKSIEIKEVK